VSIVRHHGRVGSHRFFSGASTDKLVEGVKRWIEHASEDACKEAVKPFGAYRIALAEIGTGKVGRGLSEHRHTYLVELVRQAGVAHQPDPNKSDEQNKQDRQTRDTAHELGLIIGREQTKEKHKKARLVRRRYKHTDLKAFIDGMDFAARMKYLLDLLPDTDRDTFNNKRAFNGTPSRCSATRPRSGSASSPASIRRWTSGSAMPRRPRTRASATMSPKTT